MPTVREVCHAALALLALYGIGLRAQEHGEKVARGPDRTQEDKRILGVIAANKTVDEPSQAVGPMPFRDKLKLGAEDSFDPHGLPGLALSAAIGQWQNQYRSFGQGSRGFAKRYGEAFADQAVGNMMVEAVFPRLLHEDPRYFRLAKGSLLRRAEYALSRVVITRTDSGGRNLNFTELLGNGAAAALSNLYHPAEYRSVSQTMRRAGLTVLTDAPFNLLQEFWPDIRRKVFHK